MQNFLYGLSAGLGVAASGVVGILVGYNPLVVPEWEAAADALGLCILALFVAASIAGAAAMILQYRTDAEARRLQAAKTERDELL